MDIRNAFRAVRWVILCLLLVMSSLGRQVCAMAQEAIDTCPYQYSISDSKLLHQGITAYEEQRYAEATPLLRKVSNRNPKAAEPLFYLGMCAVRQSHPAAIRRYFTRLIGLCPDYPDALAHYYRAVVYYTDEQFTEAIAELNRYFEMANTSHRTAWLVVYEEASNYLHWSTFLADAYQNPVPYNPQVIRGASSQRDEWLPYLTCDGQYLYYLRQVPQRQEKTIYAKMNEQLQPQLCMSRWHDTAFSSGTTLPYPFNQGGSEGGVTLTADNHTLCYSAAHGGNNFDLYYAQWHDDHWGELQALGPNVNDAEAWDAQPSLSPDGQLLFFASNRRGGMGGSDIWFCRRLNNGDWSRAENAGPAINTAGNEKTPFLCADGKTLFFASDGWQGLGGYDMYCIDITNTYMQRPTNLGYPINTEADNYGLGATSNGKTAYWAMRASNGIGGSDIFFFDLYPAVRPESMQLIRIKGMPPGSTVRVIRQQTDEATYRVHDTVTPVLVSAEAHSVICGEAPGCVPTCYIVSKADASRTPTLTLIAKTIRQDSAYALGLTATGLRSGTLSPTGQQLLNCYVRFLHNNPMVHIRIESRDAAEAKAVYDYLLQQQLRSERLSWRQTTACAGLQCVVTQCK